MVQKFTKKKAKKVWNKLFCPPCPTCGTTDAVELTHTGEAIICAADFIRRIANGLPLTDPDVKCYRCNKCHTVYDTKGGRIQVK